MQADAVPERVLGSREMPGAEWFPGVRLNYAEHVFRGKDDDDVAIQFASRRAPLETWTWGRLRAETARVRAGARRALGVVRGDRVVAYLPNVPETVAAFLADGLAGRGLVVVLAGLRRAVGDRPLRADRAEGAARHGHLRLRRQDLRQVRRWSSSCARSSAPSTSCCCRTGSRRRTPRSTFERVPFDHPLWVLYTLGHHRPAQGDRPGPGRHPARAPQEDAPAPQRAGGRPRLLVHHHRLDDVELPGRRAADAGVDRPLRRQPRPPGHGPPVGPRRGDRRSPSSGPARPTSTAA